MHLLSHELLMVGQIPLSQYSWFKTHFGNKIQLLNHKLKSLSASGLFEKVFSLYRLLRLSNVKPDHFTYPYVLKSCSFLSNFERGESIHSQIIKTGYGLNVFVANSLVDMYSRLWSPGSARRVFDEMPHRNLVSWNLMISGYRLNGFPETALELCSSMKREGRELDAVGLKIVLPVCAQAGAPRCGESVHAHVIVSGLSSDTVLATAILDMYAKCGNLGTAERLFGGILCKDVVTWNAMISSYSRIGKPEMVLKSFHELLVEGVKPSIVTILLSLQATADSPVLHVGNTIHGYATKVGFDRDVSVQGLLIDMYSKCGELNSACRVFSEVSKGNINSWSTMIHGLGMHGHRRASLMCFFKMLKTGIDPDGVCFLLVLTSCSHNGLVGEGRNIFYYMTRQFRIQPEMEHYACLIDLLGRAGFIDEAYRLVCGMPVEPDGNVLGAFLGACRLHCEFEMGKVALEQLVKMGFRTAGNYKLLLGLYAGRESWGDVIKIRSLMEEKKVKGITGCSLIETNSREEAKLGDVT